ncbi:MAG: ABC transporter permease [Bacteroidetes bacterium]|nr:ABC transporter permease [Bacteroidota bacterium]
MTKFRLFLTRFWATVTKETLLLVRDVAGLLVLFLMPAFLVVTIALFMDGGFNLLHDVKLDVIIVNNDQDTLGNDLEKGLRNSGSFNILKEIDGKPVTVQQAKNLVAQGKYMVAIIIPENTTKAVRNNVRKLVAETFSGFGIPSYQMMASLIPRDTSQLIVRYDPSIRRSLRVAISSNLRESTYRIETKIIFSTFNAELQRIWPAYKPGKPDYENALVFDEDFAQKENQEIIPTSVQHNVPAWTMFAIFFIAIPLTGIMVRERFEGSYLRLKTMPVNDFTLTAARILVFLIVNLLQTFLLLLIGVYIVPWVDLPALDPGHSIWAIIFIAISSGLAAIGYGMLIGSVATSPTQAAAFGAVSIIILAAMGGILVPVAVMHDILKSICLVSPLYWGLDSFNEVFLRGGMVKDILWNCFKLLIFFFVTISAAMAYSRYRENRQ